MKDTYSVRDLQRETAAAIHAAESGTLVTITRNDQAVVHMISRERLGSILETMELLADPEFMKALRKEKAGRTKSYSLSSVED